MPLLLTAIAAVAVVGIVSQYSPRASIGTGRLFPIPECEYDPDSPDLTCPGEGEPNVWAEWQGQRPLR